VHIPRDKISNEHQGFGFVEFKSEEDADYSIKIMHMIKLYGKPIKVNKASQDKRVQDVGANLFIGNLDPEVDEKTLYDTFTNFGVIISTKISRDPETGSSRGHGFVSYDNFSYSDLAISQMNGQFFSGRQIKVEYAVKKDAKGNEKHGSFAERLLAENKPNNLSKMPSLLLNNLPSPFGEKFTKLPAMPPEVPLAKGGITANLLPPPKPLFSLANSVPNIKLPPMPPLPTLPPK
jgi:splicing factor 3B subunit 4